MRSAIAIIVVGALAGGCSSGRHAAESPSASTQQNTSAAKACVMRAEGRDVLKVWMPASAQCTSSEGQLHTRANDRYVDFWLVPGASTVQDASSRAASIISGQFTGFRPTSTTPITVVGSPALRMYGEGAEADDGDPGHADVVVFALERHVFIACAHGESLSEQDRAWLMEVVRGVAAP